MRLKILFLISFLNACILSCEQKANSRGERIRVVATTGMIGDALENILDTVAEITTLMGPGVDPHLYKATQGDLARLNEADIIVYNGLHLEGKMVEILDKLKTKRTCVAMEDLISKESLISVNGFENTFDPHIWFDVALWTEAVNKLGVFLSDTLPRYRPQIKKNTENYVQDLQNLHVATGEKLNRIPKEKRILITAHDAFEYFGRAYGIEVRGLQGISTLSEAGIKDISNMVEYLVTHEIPAVFVETSVSQRSINAVVEGCRRKGHDIQIGGKLYSDALGEKGSPQGSYIGTVEWNTETIANALSK